MFSVNHTSSSIRLPGITELGQIQYLGCFLSLLLTILHPLSDRFLCSQSPTQGKTSGIFSSVRTTLSRLSDYCISPLILSAQSLAIFTDSVDASDPSRYTAKVPAFPPATYPGHIIRVDSNYTSAWSDALRRPRLSVEKPNPMYSIDVLRLDPSKSSLDWHLSSRMAFEHNTSGSEDAPCTTFAGERSTTQSQISQPTAQLPRSLWAYRFPISPYSARLSVIVDDANYARKHSGNLYRTSEEEYSRRRHICPFCRMRFKRPSGLRTHLNTHTGATRKLVQLIQFALY